MARKEQKIIPMTFDENFYRKMADQNINREIIEKQLNIIEMC